MLRRGELQTAMGGAPLVHESRIDRLAQANGRTYCYYHAVSSGQRDARCVERENLSVLLSIEPSRNVMPGGRAFSDRREVS